MSLPIALTVLFVVMSIIPMYIAHGMKLVKRMSPLIAIMTLTFYGVASHMERLQTASIVCCLIVVVLWGYVVINEMGCEHARNNN